MVQVSFDDALAYTQRLRRNLSTEAQFEYASRGGLTQERFAWEGNDAVDITAGRIRMMVTVKVVDVIELSGMNTKHIIQYGGI